MTTTITGVLHVFGSRKHTHVVAVELVSDGPAEVRYPHDRALCGVLVRSEPRDLDLSRVTCTRCVARADRLVAES